MVVEDVTRTIYLHLRDDRGVEEYEKSIHPTMSKPAICVVLFMYARALDASPPRLFEGARRNERNQGRVTFPFPRGKRTNLRSRVVLLLYCASYKRMYARMYALGTVPPIWLFSSKRHADLRISAPSKIHRSANTAITPTPHTRPSHPHPSLPRLLQSPATQASSPTAYLKGRKRTRHDDGLRTATTATTALDALGDSDATSAGAGRRRASKERLPAGEVGAQELPPMSRGKPEGRGEAVARFPLLSLN